MSNERLHSTTQHIEWTHLIDAARVRWIGHLLRMPENTPARIALAEAERRVKLPHGRQRITWLKCAQDQLLNNHNITWAEAKTIAEDRTQWWSLTKQ